jgi:hypothetical protein
MFLQKGNAVKKYSLFAIAVIAVLALTAAIGSASASASVVLCKSPSHPCASSEILPAGSWNTYAVPSGYLSEPALTLKTSGGRVYTCGGAVLGEETTAESGSGSLPATGHRQFNSCTSGGTSCTVAESESSDHLYSVLGQSWIVSGPFTLSINCGGYVCAYNGSYSTKNSYSEKEAAYIETASGSFTLTSGSKFICGGETLTMNTGTLFLGTENYIETT